MNLKHFFTALALTLCTISAAVIITLNFRPLYYMDMDYYNLSENTGYPEKEIRENYDALIDYNSVFFRDALDFPTLPMSEEGRIHFVEVKRIFVFIQAVLFPLSLIGSLLGIYFLRHQKPAYLKLASFLNLALPALLGILIALNWDQFFVKFHELLFYALCSDDSRHYFPVEPSQLYPLPKKNEAPLKSRASKINIHAGSAAVL